MEIAQQARGVCNDNRLIPGPITLQQTLAQRREMINSIGLLSSVSARPHSECSSLVFLSVLQNLLDHSTELYP